MHKQGLRNDESFFFPCFSEDDNSLPATEYNKTLKWLKNENMGITNKNCIECINVDADD